MLPGFRFLFAAIVLSMSVLIFGLGAAALLRAAHEQFASIPTRRPVPETMFAQQPNEASKPVLAMLRVETQPAAQNVPDKAPVADTPTEPVTASTPAEPERIAALKPEPSSPQEMIAKPEIPVAGAAAPSDAAPAPAAAPASVPETRIATIEDAPTTANQALAVQATLPAPAEPAVNPELAASSSQPEQAAAPAQAPLPASEEANATPVAPVAPKIDTARTKTATLGGAPVTVEKPRPARADGAKPADAAKPDNSVKKQQQARKAAAKRRRLVARARVLRAPPQPLDPFGQPTITTARTR